MTSASPGEYCFGPYPSRWLRLVGWWDLWRFSLCGGGPDAHHGCTNRSSSTRGASPASSSPTTPPPPRRRTRTTSTSRARRRSGPPGSPGRLPPGDGRANADARLAPAVWRSGKRGCRCSRLISVQPQGFTPLRGNDSPEEAGVIYAVWEESLSASTRSYCALIVVRGVLSRGRRNGSRESQSRGKTSPSSHWSPAVMDTF